MAESKRVSVEGEQRRHCKRKAMFNISGDQQASKRINE